MQCKFEQLSKSRSLEFVLDSVNYLEEPAKPFCLEEEQQELLHRRVSYGNEAVSVRRDLKADLAIKCWPEVGEACVCDVVDYVDDHLRDDLLDPTRCLLPESSWPAEPPKSRVHASDSEWYSLCVAAAARGMFAPVEEGEIFCNQFGQKILNGAMAVDKAKVIDGVERTLQRFICILTPINAYMRKLRGDAWTLPQVHQLGCKLLSEGEYVLTNGEDCTSAFNLLRLPPQWRAYFAFSKQVSKAVFGGPAGELTHVAMTAVPMGWSASVDIIQNFMRKFVFEICGSPGIWRCTKRQHSRRRTSPLHARMGQTRLVESK